MQKHLTITTLAPFTAACAVEKGPLATAKRLIRFLGSLMLSAVIVMSTPALVWAQQGQFQIEEASITDIHNAIRSGQTTCQQIVQAYLERTKAYNGACTALVTKDGAPIPAATA